MFYALLKLHFPFAGTLIFLFVAVLSACSDNVEQTERQKPTPPRPEIPVIIGDAEFSIDENTQLVTTLIARDSDTPDNELSFSVSTDANTDGSFFEFVAGTQSELQFVDAPNFEDRQDSDVNNEYLVRVSVSDGANQSTKLLVITITNVNETPELPALVNESVVENTQNVTTVAVMDPENDPLIFEITGGDDSDKLSIDRNTGVLIFNQAPDYEMPDDSGGDRSYDIVLSVSDAEFTVSQTMNISVTNDNDIAPRFTTSTTTPSIFEGNNLDVINVTATDDDGDNVTLSLAGGADGSSFSLSNGVLSFLSAPTTNHVLIMFMRFLLKPSMGYIKLSN